MRALLAGARRKQPALLHLLRRLVESESPSANKAAVDTCITLAASHSKDLGGHIKLHRQRAFGDVLEAHFGPRTKLRAKSSSGSPSTHPILLLGHLDTVWPIGSLRAMPWRMTDGRITGPGILDMKAGVAMAFTAVEMLAEANLLQREIIFLLNPDEEVGSPVSRPITEQLAAQCAAVFVLEPAQGLAYKTARKGTGNWRIEVAGVAAHAGLDFTDLRRGLTVSVGTAGGGSATNVVPAHAWAEVDVRIARKTDGPRIERRFAALRSSDPRCSLKLIGGINRPPMERTRGTVQLYRHARALAAELDYQLPEAAVGGASDGNFTSALGVPTLDGMGAVGEGAHAAHESIVLEHLAPRTALLAGMLAAC